jgi:uncharacterized protein (TIGR02722 family)
MKNLLIVSAGIAALALTGCKDPVVYEDSDSSRTITNLDKINIQDFAKAAESLTTSFSNSEAFGDIVAAKKATGKKPVVAISSVRNDTSSQFDTDILTQKIYASVIRTGKVVISSTMGGAKDNLTRDLQQQDNFAQGRDTLPKTPEYTLTGKILEDKSQAGSVKQTSYIFNLSVSEVATGNMVWAEQKIITKQGEKDSVGW